MKLRFILYLPNTFFEIFGIFNAIVGSYKLYYYLLLLFKKISGLT